MSIDFVLQGMIVWFVTQTSSELSHWMGDRGCNPHLNLRLAKGNHFLGADIESTELGFSRRQHDTFDDMGNGEDWSIVVGDWYIF